MDALLVSNYQDEQDSLEDYNNNGLAGMFWVDLGSGNV